VEGRIGSGTSHCNNGPDSESAVFASGIRTFDILRHGKSKLTKCRSGTDRAPNGKDFHPDVGNLGKPLSEGYHYEQISSWLADLLSVRFCVFQLFEIVSVVDLENENPTLSVGFAID
jgi:hypothetical protein